MDSQGNIVDDEICISPSDKKSKRFFKHRSHICMFCNVNTKTLKLLNEHLEKFHCDLIFCCDICNFYIPRHDLLIHMGNHAEEKHFNNIESKTSTKEASSKGNVTSTYLKIALESSGRFDYCAVKFFACTICDCKFKSKRVLQNHNISIHGSSQRNYSCDMCGKNFKTDSTLYVHKKIHNDIKSHQCNVCQKSFRMKHHLVHHMAQHETVDKDELPHKCNHCMKKFKRRDNLRKHLSIHKQAIEDFICHLCNAKMRQKRYLRQHMLKVHLQRLPTR